MNTGYVISAVIAFFLITWVAEYCYGYFQRNNTYQLKEFLSNVSLGVTSTMVSAIVGIFSVPLYLWIDSNFGIFTVSINNVWHWLFAFAFYDLIYYWNHRWHHEISILWAGHSVHHSGDTFNYSTSVRLGMIASLTSWLMFMLMALIGIGIEFYLVIYAVQLAYQHLIHTQHIPKLGWLEYVFYTPSQHRVHHSKNKPYLDKNYGCFFCVFDRLFNTYAEERPSEKPLYGITQPIQSETPSRINFSELLRIKAALLRLTGFKRRMSIIVGSPSFAMSIMADSKGFDHEPEKQWGRVSQHRQIEVNEPLIASPMRKLGAALAFISALLIALNTVMQIQVLSLSEITLLLVLVVLMFDIAFACISLTFSVSARRRSLLAAFALLILLNLLGSITNVLWFFCFISLMSHFVTTK